MSQPINPLRRVWAEGRPAINGWVAAPSIITAEAMGAAKWDALTVDLQHGTADYASLLSMLPVIQASGAAPLVRVPWLDEGIVMRVLDAGAMGVIAPMIETPEDAARLVSACNYPPKGGRSFGPVRARLAWGNDYPSFANNEVLPLAMIETKKGVEALDEIVSIPGLAGIYIGPADLSFSHGFAPGFDRHEPEMLEIIFTILEATKTAGIRCCLHCGTAEYAVSMADKGFAMFTVASDARFVEAGATSVVNSFRSGIGALATGADGKGGY